MNRRMKLKILKITAVAVLITISAAMASTNSYNNEGIKLLEKGDFISAIVYLEQALREEPRSQVIKKNLALAYNNYGVKLLKDGKPSTALDKFAKARKLFPNDKGFRGNAAKAYNDLAIKALEEKNYIVAENYLYSALRLQPQETAIRTNLSVCLTNYGVQYYEKKQYELARGKLVDAVSFDETNATAHAFLGNVYYYTQQLEKALASFRNALKHDPNLEYARDKIKALKKEISVEGKLTDSRYSIFKILYNSDDAKIDLGSVQQALWDAYYGIGAVFQQYPQHTVVVILYPPEEFKKIRDAPTWVAGIYDGKIRIPYPEDLTMSEVEKIIRHEYTHVIIHDISKGKCVNWLNEGLARTMEYTGNNEGPNYKRLIQAFKKGQIIDLDALSKNFIYTEDPQKAALAYQQSTSLVAYIIDQYGFYKVHNMINHYAKGKTTDKILSEEFYKTPDRFINDWKDYVYKYIIQQ